MRNLTPLGYPRRVLHCWLAAIALVGVTAACGNLSSDGAVRPRASSTPAGTVNDWFKANSDSWGDLSAALVAVKAWSAGSAAYVQADLCDPLRASATALAASEGSGNTDADEATQDLLTGAAAVYSDCLDADQVRAEGDLQEASAALQRLQGLLSEPVQAAARAPFKFVLESAPAARVPEVFGGLAPTLTPQQVLIEACKVFFRSGFRSGSKEAQTALMGIERGKSADARLVSELREWASDAGWQDEGPSGYIAQNCPY